MLIGKFEGAQEKVDEQKRFIPTMSLFPSKDEGFQTLQNGLAMSINELIYNVIELIVNVGRTSTSSAPFGIPIVDYWGWNREFGALDVHASSRKLSDLDHTSY